MWSSGESGEYVKRLMEDVTLRRLEWLAQIKGLSTESGNLLQFKNVGTFLGNDLQKKKLIC